MRIRVALVAALTLVGANVAIAGDTTTAQLLQEFSKEAGPGT